MRRLCPSVLVLALSLSAVAPAVSAQTASPPAARLTIEIETRERWMNARQMAIHTPTVRTTHLISLDSIVTDSVAATRTFWGRSGQRMMMTDALRFTTRLDGHLTSVEVTPRPSPALAMMRTARDSARTARFGLVDFNGAYLTLPAARAWDAVPVFRARRLQPGERWIDTLSFATTVRDMQQSVSGRRTFIIVRDTLVAERRLWIVRDSAAVELNERYPIDERRLDSLATIERHARGTIVGRSLYDPGTGLFRTRSDSTALTGEATLRYPDGRAFRSPTRFERARKWTLYEPAELARRDALLAAQRDSNSFSIVRVPRNAFEQQLAAGDKPTLDSLYSAWFASKDADRRAEIKQLLNSWGTFDSAGRARFYAARTAEGDTSFLVGGSRYDERGRITLRYARLLLPLMRDPGLAFQYGVSRDIAYEQIVETLARTPPAIEPDTAKWLCEPAACRLLGEQWNSATEPRLRSVGLAVLTLVNPRQWRDTFLIRANAGDNVLQLALPIVDGAVRQGGLSLVARPNPVPPAGASWEAWRDWLRGPASSTPAVPPPSGRGALPPPPPRWMMNGGNSLHLRFLHVATGRDIAGELTRLFANAPDDTARVVLGNILGGIGALPFGPDSIAKYAVSPSSLLRSFAARLITGGFGEAGVLTWVAADSALNDIMHDRVLAARVSRREPWPSVEQKLLLGSAGPFQEPPSDAPGASHPIFYRSDSLSVRIREKWSDRVSMMTGAEWRTRPVRQGGELWSISRVWQSGPFARISVDVSGQIERAPGQGPQAWASWTTYYLILVDGEWVLVTKTSAVT